MPVEFLQQQELQSQTHLLRFYKGASTLALESVENKLESLQTYFGSFFGTGLAGLATGRGAVIGGFDASGGVLEEDLGVTTGSGVAILGVPLSSVEGCGLALPCSWL